MPPEPPSATWPAGALFVLRRRPTGRQRGDAMSVQASIEVALDERGPTVIRIAQRDRAGHELALEREDPYLLEAEERAFREVLPAGMRLACGSGGASGAHAAGSSCWSQRTLLTGFRQARRWAVRSPAARSRHERQGCPR